MAHLHRFHIQPESAHLVEIVLPPEESHHALHVVRLRVGDAVALFDGCGVESLARVVELGKRDVRVIVENRHTAARPAPALTLASAWLHRDKVVEEVIRYGTELGVGRFLFFRAARSEKSPRGEEKWTRWAIEACKQCGRLWLPEFTVAGNLADALERATGDLLIASMELTPCAWADGVRGRDVTLFIGPEGDFTAEETSQALACGARPVSLGAATFRAETAAVVGAALVQHHLGHLGPR